MLYVPRVQNRRRAEAGARVGEPDRARRRQGIPGTGVRAVAGRAAARSQSSSLDGRPARVISAGIATPPRLTSLVAAPLTRAPFHTRTRRVTWPTTTRS